MTNNNKGDQVGRVQQILMDKNNMNIVHEELENQK